MVRYCCGRHTAMYRSTVTARVMYVEAQNATADIGYRTYTYTCDKYRVQ